MVMRKNFLLNCVLIVTILIGCGSQREVAERRALMMPRKSEMPRNAKKFKEVEYNKRSKHQKKQSKKINKYNRQKSVF
jgi:hypothetical protein